VQGGKGMKATWGAAALLLACVVNGSCHSSTSCGAFVSEYTSPSGVHGCWQYTEDYEGVVVGTPVPFCPSADQLGACALEGDRAAACGEIYYTDNGLTADQARRDCVAAGGTWSP
jgi:hypothetical protein